LRSVSNNVKDRPIVELSERIYESTKLAALFDVLVDQGCPAGEILENVNLTVDEVHSPKSRISLAELMTACKNAIRLVWGFLCQGGVTPIWSSFAFHSFVRPAPRALFRPDRIFPSPSRRSGGQGRRFFSAAEGLSLTDASTAAGCRRSGGWPCDDPRGACHWPRSIARTTLVFG
jgi:hypothetical protein